MFFFAFLIHTPTYCSIKRYYNVVDQVAETSMSLALLLPHLLYIGGCLALKLTLPSLLRYTANGTYTYELISLYYPVFRTARLISVKQSQAKKGYSSTVNTSNADKSKQQTRGSVASRWLGATTADTGSSSKSKLTTKDDSRNSKIMDIDTEASMLLRYWVVYGLIFSMMKAIVLIPFIGPYLSVSGTTAAALNKTPTVTGARFSSFRLLNSKWISYLIPTPYFFYEVRLTFFIWLRLLPTSKTANNLDNESSSSSASRKRKSKYEYLSLSPLDMIYKKLAPIALSLADKSNAVASSATNRLNKHTPDNSKNSVSTIVSIGNKLSSILDLAVLVRVISSKNKDRIVTLVSESYALLPACITLFMPSRFTSYGCIYASAIIPAANSANCETSLGTQGHLRGTNAYKKAKEDRILYLKYWVMNALFLLLLDFVFFTFLQWVPLSTHMTLLVWISLNMPLICKKAYEYLEYELVMFGVLDVEYIENYDMEKTLTVRFFKKLSSSIPVAKKDEDDVQQDTNSRNSKGKKESVATEKSTIAYEVEVDSSDKTSSTDKIDDTPSVNNVVDDENDSVENSTNNTKIDNPTKSITYDVEVNSSDTISPTDKIDDTPLVNNVVDDENDYAENSTDNTKIDNPTK